MNRRQNLVIELLASLDPARPQLCALICAVLGRVGSPRAVPALRELQSSPNDHLSEAATAALEVISARLRRDFPEPVAAIRR